MAELTSPLPATMSRAWPWFKAARRGCRESSVAGAHRTLSICANVHAQFNHPVSLPLFLPMPPFGRVGRSRHREADDLGLRGCDFLIARSFRWVSSIAGYEIWFFGTVHEARH
eukprot:2810945-Rhodomonas_salina.3